MKKTTFKRIISVVIVVLLICSLCPISTFAHSYYPPAQQSITYDVNVGQSIILPSQGYGGEWNSSDTNVAAVNSFGYVTGISEGTAKITRTVYNYYFFYFRSIASTTEYTVNVKNHVVPKPEPEPEPDDSTHIKVGESITLNAGFRFWTVWSSSDMKVAVVSNNGTVTGKSVGTATIRASYMIGWFNFFGFGQMSCTEFKITVDPGDTPTPPETVYHTVKFNSNGGSSVQEQKVQDGAKAIKPNDPEKGSSVFKGWFTDNETFANEYDFDSAVNTDIELFAKWDEEGIKIPDNPTDSDKYYWSISEKVLEVIDASKSDDLLTESEAYTLLTERGFIDFPISFLNSIDGEYEGETEVSVDSTVKHPLYQTYYLNSSGELWTVYIINGDVFAYPASYNLESGSGVELLISESTALTSYNDTDNKFYVTIPKSSEAIVKLVETINPETLDKMTSEELSK